MKWNLNSHVIACLLAALWLVSPVSGATTPEAQIADKDVKNVNFSGLNGSGMGTFDAILFTGNGTNDNNYSSLDMDDANNTLPTGGSGKTYPGSVYVTSWGELRSFYTQQYLYTGSGLTQSDLQITFFLDLTEAGNDKGIEVDHVDVFTGVDFAAITGSADDRDNSASNDLTSAQQGAGTPAQSGSTVTRAALIANNDYYLRALESAAQGKLVGTTSQGNGLPEGVIVTGLNPYDSRFADSDNFVVWFQSSEHSAGGDDLMLSGEFIMSNLNAGIPLPPALASIVLLLPLGIAWRLGVGRSLPTSWGLA